MSFQGEDIHPYLLVQWSARNGWTDS